MTTSLSSDVPVGYFSWAEYDVMAPVQPKTEKALAAAFISNCIAQNFRLQALEALMEANVTIDSYGTCHRNRNERGMYRVIASKMFCAMAVSFKFFNQYNLNCLQWRRLKLLSTISSV